MSNKSARRAPINPITSAKWKRWIVAIGDRQSAQIRIKSVERSRSLRRDDQSNGMAPNRVPECKMKNWGNDQL